jgi:hypothetical protein
MELFVKDVKINGNCDAKIKSKFTNDSVTLQIFMRIADSGEHKRKNHQYKISIYAAFILGEWRLLSFKSSLEDFSRIISPKISVTTFKRYITTNKNDDDEHAAKIIIYEYDAIKSILLVLERKLLNSQDEDNYADIIYAKIPLQLQKTNLHDCMIIEYIDEIKFLSEELISKKLKIENYTKDLHEICTNYEKLLKEKQLFEENVYKKFLLLLNSKKKYIKDKLITDEKKQFNLSSDFEHSDLQTSINERQDAQEPTSTKYLTPTKNTPKKVTTPRSKRTPSRKFLASQCAMNNHDDDDSDMDDEFDIIPLSHVTPTKSKSNKGKSIFKDFKIQTPLKKDDEVERDRRESSIELLTSMKLDEKSLTCTQNSESDSDRGKKTSFELAQRIGNDSQKSKTPTSNDDQFNSCEHESQAFLIDNDSNTKLDNNDAVNASRVFGKRHSSRLFKNSFKKPKSNNSFDQFETDTIDILKNFS